METIESKGHSRAPIDRYRELFDLAWPQLIGASAFTISFIAAVAIAGRRSTDDLAAISISLAILIPINTALSSLFGSLTARFSEEFGQSSESRVGEIAWQAAWLSLLVAVGVMVLFFCARLVLIPWSVSSLVAELASRYILVSLAGLPLLCLVTIFSSMLAALKMVRSVMRLNLALSIAFVPLVWILTVPDLSPLRGAMGLAIAITLVQLVSATVLLVWAHRALPEARLLYYRPANSREFKSLLMVGGPLGLSTLVRLSARAAVVVVFAGTGAEAIAAYQASSSLFDVLMLPLVSLASTLPITLGRALGKRETSLLRDYLMRTLGLGTATSLILLLILFSCGEWMVALFTADPAVQAATNATFVVLAVFLLARSAVLASEACLTVAKRTRVTVSVNIVGGWLVSVPMALFFDYIGYKNAVALMICLAAGSAFVAVVQFVRAHTWMSQLSVSNPV